MTEEITKEMIDAGVDCLISWDVDGVARPHDLVREIIEAALANRPTLTSLIMGAVREGIDLGRFDNEMRRRFGVAAAAIRR